MDKSAFNRLRVWFDDYVEGYLKKFPLVSTEGDTFSYEVINSLTLKKEHTLRVIENITHIAQSLGLDDNDINIAKASALLHDIGRFPQYVKYKTFNDANSVNHGLLSEEIIKESKILEDIKEEEREAIVTAVRFHNSFHIPNLPKERLLFLKLLRDADKLDIWRIFAEYFSNPLQGLSSGAFLGLPDTEGVSQQIILSLREKRLASLKDAMSINDFRLIQLSWVFDLNFRESFRILKEKGYLSLIVNIKKDLSTMEAINSVFEYIEKRINPKVYFVGSGPGDPELITIKGKRLLESADVIIYAGSLVNPALLEGTKAEVYNSAKMTLEEIIEVMRKAILEGKTVVRLHSGDPSLYSAISEQIERLRNLNIEYEVIPGVSSAMAGAAILRQELTIPEISQTVIFTRLEGKTPVPERERLRDLAKSRATMVIFLSAGMIEKVKEELLQGYPEDTPIVIIEKASWPDERIIRGVLKDLDALVNNAGIKKTALIYVGDALRASIESLGKESRLYNRDFRHEYRG